MHVTMNSTELIKTLEGQTVAGKFPLGQWLGGSEQRAVFLTERGGQKAAIKLIAADGIDADRQLDHWATSAKLSHSHVLRLFEAGRYDFDGKSFLYVVMEYAEENLSQIIPDRALTPAEVGELLPPVLDALSYLHGKELVHGRVRPSNILAIDNQLKLSAESISPWGDAETKSTSPNIDVYDAPEIVAGEISPAIDVWSLGATLVAILTQRPPVYRGKDNQQDPAVPGNIPEPFLSIARECLHRVVKQRCTIADIRAWRPPQAAPAPVVTQPTKNQSAKKSTKSKDAPVPAPPIAADPLPTHAKKSRARIVIPAAVVVIAVFVWISLGHKNSQEQSSTAQPSAATSAETSAPTPPPVAQSQAAAKPPKAATMSGAVVHQVIPEASQSARNTITGKIKVVVRVDVDASGKVTGAKLTHGGPSHYFANLAVKAAQQWGFSPQPGPSRWNLTFQFSRSGIKAFPQQERARH
jgi:TonB family protein